MRMGYDVNGMMSMVSDANVLRELSRIYKLLKEDESFTMAKYIRMVSNILRGERIVKHEGRYVISTFLPPFPSQAFETNIRAVKEQRNIFTQQAYAKRSAPISMHLSLTSACPNNCIYCSEKSRKTSRELSKDEWIGIISQLQDMNTPVIGFTGGEPMTRDDIYEIVGSVDNRSVSLLFTSGFNLTAHRAQKLKNCGLFGIGISLDSHDRQVHNGNRRSEEAFDFAIEAIRNASAAGLYTMVQTVVARSNVIRDDLFRLFAISKECGAHEVKLLEPIPSGRIIDMDGKDSLFHDEHSRRRMVQIQHEANSISEFPKITSFAYTESEAKFGCGAGSQHSYISSCGDLFPCDFVPMSFGNVVGQDLSQLWQGMNEKCGIPRTQCLSRSLNDKIYKGDEGNIPLAKADSERLIRQSPSEGFPKYYRDMQ